MEPNLQQNPQVNVPPNVSPTPVQNIPNHENKSSIGSIIGTIIVIAIIILGGLYFWGKRIDEARMNEKLVSGETEQVTETPNDDMEANSIKSVSSSDEIDSIEAELKATSYDNLDAELDSEAELE